MFRSEESGFSCNVWYQNIVLNQVYKTASALNTVTVRSLFERGGVFLHIKVSNATRCPDLISYVSFISAL